MLKSNSERGITDKINKNGIIDDAFPRGNVRFIIGCILGEYY